MIDNKHDGYISCRGGKPYSHIIWRAPRPLDSPIQNGYPAYGITVGENEDVEDVSGVDNICARMDRI